MLQIYDRVLSSGNQETLIMLSALAVFLLVILGVLETTRSRIMTRVGLRLSEDIQQGTFDSLLNHRLVKTQSVGTQPIRDLDTLRQFFASNSLFAFIDAPWTPFFLMLIFFLHPLLGAIATGGAFLIFSFALVTELVSRSALRNASSKMIDSHAYVNSSLRNADVLKAMGMEQNIRNRWRSYFLPATEWQTRAGERVGIMLGASKSLRFILQTAILGAGAWLALKQIITPGAMIAGSIIMGRALAPVEQAIGSWKSFIGARAAWKRVNILLDQNPKQEESIELPHIEGNLKVENLIAAPPGVKQAILKGIKFDLKAGESLAVIGPSGSGKSTLARLLMGVWLARNGNVTLDGASITQLNPKDRQKYIGYLPQDVELFSGTVKDNISRFNEVDSEKLFSATQMTDCHELILALPEGYETEIGESGGFLSGGQRQRLGLARAVYGNPALVVLDEPNSNLDSKGEKALLQTIAQLKKRKVTLVIIAHNVNIMAVVDNILMLQNGKVVKYGPSSELLKSLGQLKN